MDGQPLQGYSNHDAVEVLRNTGQVVNLKLARYQHGAKFEKLQQYLGKTPLNNLRPSVRKRIFGCTPREDSDQTACLDSQE